MHILLSNDDGVHAIGLKVLAEAAASFGDVSVIAPDRDQSAASHSLTVDRPLRITKTETGFFAVNGTPTDSVHVAITGYLQQKPDLVLTGINFGSNLGDDVIYSGTVAAAMEARSLGIPAVALSLVITPGKHYFDTAAVVVKSLLKHLINSKIPNIEILNVNIPNIPASQLQGFQVTRLGKRHLAEKIIKDEDPRGRTIYWIGPAGKGQDAGVGTDFHAISNNYVSLTPITSDLTHTKELKALEKWVPTEILLS